WHRAQVLYLLHLAQDELSLAGNVATALAALQAADAQLRRWPGANLQAVRAKIRNDIAALQALPNPDITGMALTLNALAAQATTLPLRAQAPDNYHALPEAAAGAEQGFWQRLWRGLSNSFSAMVSVRRNATPVKPLLTPNQEALVYQHLALQLQTARLALLKGDYKNYRASLMAAQNGVTRWFDTSHSATQAVLAEIERLLATPLPVELPTLSATAQVLEEAAAIDNDGDQP
ncbi:MAG TPA: uroporphyrinogen-III C-methyltransferase, partial [Gammaproteobacteria bacterium]|nr:uroporphyrinogen-III C-methyltransferase [Gammaproteobacteria bacterium]